MSIFEALAAKLGVQVPNDPDEAQMGDALNAMSEALGVADALPSFRADPEDSAPTVAGSGLPDAHTTHTQPRNALSGRDAL